MNATIGVTLIGLVAVALYAVLGGADFGGGVWDLLASGPRKGEQRRAISGAMGPVWEANHVWLIFIIVLLFTCFPVAFATFSVALYVPLTLVALGIVLRGAAFAFRAHAHEAAHASLLWGRVFGVASLITPLFFGAAAGAVAGGGISQDRLSAAWSTPFSLAIGVFAVTVCAQLAAVFLTMESPGALRDDFRIRAVLASVAVAFVGALGLWFALHSHGLTFSGLVGGRGLASVGIAMVLGVAVVGSLLARRYALARVAVVAEVVAILAGWFAAQAPYLIPPHLTISAAAAPQPILSAFMLLVGVGATVLVPSLWLLFRVFKGRNPAADAF